MRLIDADALMESAELFEVKTYARGSGRSIVHFAKAWLSNEIAKALTIEAEPVRHGRWIDAYCGKYANAKYICSCCGKRAHSDDWKWELSDFCPHCGARMDGDSR